MKPDNMPLIAIGSRLSRRSVLRGFASMFGAVMVVDRLIVVHRSGNGGIHR